MPEIDSDPDFNPGVYIEPKPKKKTKRTAKGKGLKRIREDSDDEFDLSMARPKKSTLPPNQLRLVLTPLLEYRPEPESVNPLLQYFGESVQHVT